MHIAIAGNIGSGKTTLANLLSQHYGWVPHYEDTENNPYLNDFYNDMPRWAFELQIYFLQTRLSKILEIRNSGKNVVQDRTVYEDAYIFAANLHEMGLMSSRDYKNYTGIFELMSSLISPPDLLIYLRANVSTLLKQIRSRGREYEQGISPEYLTKLNVKYEKWISSYKRGKLLVLDADNLDFPNREEDMKFLTNQINSLLNF